MKLFNDKSIMKLSNIIALMSRQEIETILVDSGLYSIDYVQEGLARFESKEELVQHILFDLRSTTYRRLRKSDAERLLLFLNMAHPKIFVSKKETYRDIISSEDHFDYDGEAFVAIIPDKVERPKISRLAPPIMRKNVGSSVVSEIC